MKSEERKIVIGLAIGLVVVFFLIGYSYDLNRKAEQKVNQEILKDYLKPTESEAPVRVVGSIGNIVVVEPIFDPSIHLSVQVENSSHYPLGSEWWVVETHYPNGEVVRRLEKKED